MIKKTDHLYFKINLGVPASPSRFPLQVLVSLRSTAGFPLQSLTQCNSNYYSFSKCYIPMINNVSQLK